MGFLAYSLLWNNAGYISSTVGSSQREFTLEAFTSPQGPGAPGAGDFAHPSSLDKEERERERLGFGVPYFDTFTGYLKAQAREREREREGEEELDRWRQNAVSFCEHRCV